MTAGPNSERKSRAATRSGSRRQARPFDLATGLERLLAAGDAGAAIDAALDGAIALVGADKGCLVRGLATEPTSFERGRDGRGRRVAEGGFVLRRRLIAEALLAGRPRSAALIGRKTALAIPLPPASDDASRTLLYLVGRRAATGLPTGLTRWLEAASRAIARHRERDRVEREQRRLSALYRLAMAAGTAADLESLLGSALGVALVETRGERGFIQLLATDDEDGEREPEFVGRQRDGRAASEADLGIDSASLGVEVARGEAATEARIGRGPHVLTRTRVALVHEAAPGAGRRPLGVIAIDHKSRADCGEILAMLAEPIASSVQSFDLREANVEKRRIQDEIRQAEKVQSLLLPRSEPDIVGLGFDVEYRLSRGLGGDYYDFIEMEGDRMGIAIADVLGHSVSSAIVMSTCRTLLREYCRHGSSPAEILGKANDSLERNLPDDMFVTLFLGVLDLRTHGLTYANAGQCYPLHFRAAGRTVEVLAVGGLPLGFQRGVTYREARVELAPADLLVLYTDGVTEVRPNGTQPLGVAGLTQIVRRVMVREASHLAHEIYRSILEDAGDRTIAPTDDVTLIALRVGREVERESWEIPSTEAAVRSAVVRAERFARTHGFISERILQFRLVITEALMNALEHGNRSDASKTIAVLLAADRRRMSVRIRDEGGGFELDRVLDSTADSDVTSTRGRGVTIIKRYVDSLQVSEQGNAVTLTFSRSAF